MANVVVVGTQWGDEGKGKVVDIYAENADVIARFQGGNNAGHTLVVKGEQTILHLIPSGILHAGKICMIGNGVVVDPPVLLDELESLRNRNLLPESTRLYISEKAHLIMPYHRRLDVAREAHGVGKKIVPIVSFPFQRNEEASLCNPSRVCRNAIKISCRVSLDQSPSCDLHDFVNLEDWKGLTSFQCISRKRLSFRAFFAIFLSSKGIRISPII